MSSNCLLFLTDLLFLPVKPFKRKSSDFALFNDPEFAPVLPGIDPVDAGIGPVGIAPVAVPDFGGSGAPISSAALSSIRPVIIRC